MPPKLFNLLQKVISSELANSWGLSTKHKSLYLKKKPNHKQQRESATPILIVCLKARFLQEWGIQLL